MYIRPFTMSTSGIIPTYNNINPSGRVGYKTSDTYSSESSNGGYMPHYYTILIDSRITRRRAMCL